MDTQAKFLSQEGCDSSCDRGDVGAVPEVRTIPDLDPCAAAGAIQGDPPEATGKRRPSSPEKNRKHAAYAALLKQGLTKSHAAKALGYSIGSIGMLDNAIEKKNLTSSVSCDSNARIARKAVRLLAQAKTFGCIETVRAADVLRASEIILDRAEPKIQAVAPPSHSFININLDIFKPDPPPPKTIDLELGSGEEPE